MTTTIDQNHEDEITKLYSELLNHQTEAILRARWKFNECASASYIAAFRSKALGSCRPARPCAIGC